GFASSHLLDLSIRDLVNSYLEKMDTKPLGGKSYYVMNLDKKGRLTSEDPEALLYLMFHALTQSNFTDAIHYLKLFEGIGKRLPYSKEIFSNIQTFEIFVLALDNPIMTRIAVRLAAIREENRLLQKEKSRVEKLETNALCWLSMQINYYF